MRRIIVSYFGSFGTVTANASELVAPALPAAVGDTIIDVLPLPVAFGEAARILAEKIKHVQPCAVIMLGHASKRTAVSLERRARNFNAPRTPDNLGQLPGGPVIAGAPKTLLTLLPVDTLASELARELPDVAVEVSESAGFYVCNDLYYRILRQFPLLPALFIHLPPPDRLATPRAAKAVTAVAARI